MSAEYLTDRHRTADEHRLSAFDLPQGDENGQQGVERCKKEGAGEEKHGINHLLYIMCVWGGICITATHIAIMFLCIIQNTVYTKSLYRLTLLLIKIFTR